MELDWPGDVFSLSHSALPIPPDDPLYGVDVKRDKTHIQLGRILPKGEKGLLLIPANDIIRLKYNPFYSYVEARLKEFVMQKNQ